MWRAWLEGHDFDLETLFEVIGTTGNVSVHVTTDGCYFEATTTGSPPNPPDERAAEATLEILNGAASALDAGFRPVGLAGRYTSADGAATVVAAMASLEGRGRLSVASVLVNGQPAAPAAPVGPRYVAVAAHDPNVAEALRLLALPDAACGWVKLYKLLEIVEDAAGGRAAVLDAGWATKRELEDFTATANHPALGGRHARHARQTGAPSRQPLDLSAGRDLLRRLVQRWVEAHPRY